MDHNPQTNPNAISIIRQDDGNYKGWAQKDGKLIEVRADSPQTVIQLLITHDGS